MSRPRPIVGIGTVVWKQGHILLIKRGKPPRQREWSLPGGAQEWGETIAEAAKREVKEETGLDIEVLGLIDVVDSLHRDETGALAFHHTLIDLAALWVSGEARANSDAAAVAWIKPSDLAGYHLWGETERIIHAALAFFPKETHANRS